MSDDKTTMEADADALVDGVDSIEENAAAKALIQQFDATAKGARGAFIAAAIKQGMKATTAGAYWQRNKKHATGGNKPEPDPELGRYKNLKMTDTPNPRVAMKVPSEVRSQMEALPRLFNPLGGSPRMQMLIRDTGIGITVHRNASVVKLWVSDDGKVYTATNEIGGPEDVSVVGRKAKRKALTILSSAVDMIDRESPNAADSRIASLAETLFNKNWAKAIRTIGGVNDPDEDDDDPEVLDTPEVHDEPEVPVVPDEPEVPVVADKVDMTKLIASFDASDKGARGQFIAAAVKGGQKSTTAGAFWQRKKDLAAGGIPKADPVIPDKPVDPGHGNNPFEGQLYADVVARNHPEIYAMAITIKEQHPDMEVIFGDEPDDRIAYFSYERSVDVGGPFDTTNQIRFNVMKAHSDPKKVAEVRWAGSILKNRTIKGLIQKVNDEFAEFERSNEERRQKHTLMADLKDAASKFDQTTTTAKYMLDMIADAQTKGQWESLDMLPDLIRLALGHSGTVVDGWFQHPAKAKSALDAVDIITNYDPTDFKSASKHFGNPNDHVGPHRFTSAFYGIGLDATHPEVIDRIRRQRGDTPEELWERIQQAKSARLITVPDDLTYDDIVNNWSEFEDTVVFEDKYETFMTNMSDKSPVSFDDAADKVEDMYDKLPMGALYTIQDHIGSNRFKSSMMQLWRMSGGKLNDIKFDKTDNRAFHQRTGSTHLINVGNSLDATTLWHEVGHAFEVKDPRVMALSKAYMIGRLGQQKFGKVGKDEPHFKDLNLLAHSGYSKEEIAIDDHFFTAYIGKLYPALGTAVTAAQSGNRSYEDAVEAINNVRSTEVISMGLQYFHDHRTAQRLFEEDAELFNLIVRVLEMYNE